MDLLNWLVDSDPSIRWQVTATWTVCGEGQRLLIRADAGSRSIPPGV
jgi:hypothetical protein